MLASRINIEELEQLRSVIKEQEAALLNLARYVWRKQLKNELEVPPLRLIELAKKGELEWK